MTDFEDMTVGMIMGYIVSFDNERLSDEDKEDDMRQATQTDFDKF